MYISSFHMDGFGIFHNAGVGNLPPGMVIFLGKNESGKSTCLEFLRVMLFGYQGKKSAKPVTEPLNGGRPGGSLVLKIPGAKHEEIHLSRFSGKGAGSLSLFSAAGQNIAQEELERLFAGITSDVYRSVYGFSLSELENFACLNAEGVRNALYSASFGPGINPPGAVLQALGNTQNAIFTAGSKKSLLQQMLDELDSINKRLGLLIEKNESFDAKSLELARTRKELGEIRERRKTLEEERRLFERRQTAWRYFSELRLLGLRLEDMPLHAGENFPDDGLARLRDLQKDRLHLERQLAEYREKAATIEEQQKAISINRSLADALPGLRRLAERKLGYRQALLQIPADEAALKRDGEELSDSLSRLGPGWDCQRIKNTNRSLFAREDLEKQAREMAAAASAHQACVDALAKANREVETLDREVNAAEEKLHALPEPSAILEGGERDELRQNMARLEECSRCEPIRAQALENARATFSRSFEKLHFGATHTAEHVCAGSGENLNSTPERERVLLDTLLARQEEALELASRLRGCIKVAEDLELALRQSEQETENTRKKMDDLRDRLRNEAGPGREALETKAQALRSLRTLAANIATEKERLQELDSRIGAQQTPGASRSLPLLVFGTLLFAAGAAILLGHWILGLSEYALTPGIVIPFNLWSGYLVLACGVGFLAGGLPRNGAEARQFANAMAQLQSRRETCSLHLAELGEQARNICEQAGFADADPITLDASEMLLEREKEQCYQEEQTTRELEDLQKQLDRSREKTNVLSRDHQMAEQEAQQERRRWHAFMQTLHIAAVPAPESADSLFARAENARLAYNAVAHSAAEARRNETEKLELEKRISSLPPVAEILQTHAASLSEAVGRLLESCREADSFREQRIRAAAELQNRKSALSRAETLQQESAAALQVAAARLSQSRTDWNREIASLGLGEDLNPETVREAFKCMEHCLQVESRMEGRNANLARAREEAEAFERPVAELANKFDERPARNDQGETDWPLTLDALTANAEAMDAAIRTMSRLDIQLGREKDQLRGLEAGEAVIREQIEALLQEGGASDEEEFVRLAKARDEEIGLQKNIRTMRDALKLAAGNEELSTFLNGLENLADGEIETHLAELDQTLNGLVASEDALAKNQASLDAEVSSLLASDELAQLRQQKALLVEKMEQAARSWSVHALAGAMISQARNVFERERQPAIIGVASEIFASITNGRWRGLSVSLENSTLLALPSSGEPVPPQYLSRGTQEQIYLSLRIAYIKEHARTAQTLPIIMDDILVNFDPDRARRTARTFASLVDEKQQLFYFTCNPATAKMLAEAAPGAASYSLLDGQFVAESA